MWSYEFWFSLSNGTTGFVNIQAKDGKTARQVASEVALERGGEDTTIRELTLISVSC